MGQKNNSFSIQESSGYDKSMVDPTTLQYFLDTAKKSNDMYWADWQARNEAAKNKTAADSYWASINTGQKISPTQEQWKNPVTMGQFGSMQISPGAANQAVIRSEWEGPQYDAKNVITPSLPVISQSERYAEELRKSNSSSTGPEDMPKTGFIRGLTFVNGTPALNSAPTNHNSVMFMKPYSILNENVKLDKEGWNDNVKNEAMDGRVTVDNLKQSSKIDGKPAFDTFKSWLGGYFDQLSSNPGQNTIRQYTLSTAGGGRTIGSNLVRNGNDIGIQYYTIDNGKANPIKNGTVWMFRKTANGGYTNIGGQGSALETIAQTVGKRNESQRAVTEVLAFNQAFFNEISKATGENIRKTKFGGNPVAYRQALNPSGKNDAGINLVGFNDPTQSSLTEYYDVAPGSTVLNELLFGPGGR